MFVDTSAVAALASCDDERHRDAIAIQTRLTAERRLLVSTNVVIAATHALLSGRVGPRPALRIVNDIRRGDIDLVRVSDEDERSAFEILARFADKGFSLTDAVSFADMDCLGLRLAFTLDRHLAQCGLTLVGPD